MSRHRVATLPVDATTCVSAEELPVVIEARRPGVDRVLAAGVQAGARRGVGRS